MAEEVARVAQRCEDAKTSGVLDLCDCELVQIPHAIFFLMRGSTLTQCKLSGNLLKTIPAKFADDFGDLEEVVLNRNKLSSLPDNFSSLGKLQSLCVDENNLIDIPISLLSLPSLLTLSMNNNKITDVDVSAIENCNSLKELHLQGNPLSETTLQQLKALNKVTVFV